MTYFPRKQDAINEIKSKGFVNGQHKDDTEESLGESGDHGFGRIEMSKLLMQPFMKNGKTPRCQEKIVSYIGNWPHSGQCSRSAKVGEMCGVHDPEHIAEKKRLKKDTGWTRYVSTHEGSYKVICNDAKVAEFGAPSDTWGEEMVEFVK